MTAFYQKLLGQYIVLSKSILLQEPVGEKGFELQFTASIPGLRIPGIGIAVTLWKTSRAFQAIENIARMIHANHKEAVDCDLGTIEDIVLRAIQELILDDKVFKTDDILSASQNCLAECRADADIRVFAEKIHAHAVERVYASINQWSTVLGVLRLMCESFDIPEAGLSVISRMDQDKWNESVSSKYQTNAWSQLLGCEPNSESLQLFRFECRSLVAHHSNGTQKGCKFSSRLEFAKFFAVLYAIVTIEEKMSLHPSMAEPYTLCIQFPSRSSSGLRVTQSQLEDAVFPFFCADFNLSNNAVELIQKWYIGLCSLPRGKISRVEKACHFVNKGIMTRGLDSYVHLFISLDALFGTAGDVGGSIQRGIESVSIDSSLKERISWLYRLRSELVHGGSRFCSEWQGYDRYYAHFRTKPEDDVKRIACSALLCSTVHA